MWWKEAIVYQIYPRSFKDSDGDGVGDLRGVIQKLDYIKSLGVDAVWLNPIFKSPNDDGGYDISDYYSIQPEFGSMADFDELLTGLHQRKLKLIIDLVLNHSSDEHEWFQQSRQSKTNPYRDYYFWKPGKGNQPPNNWPSFFGGSAWEKDAATDEYYLHLFSRKQPDLNWENPQLRSEVHQLMKFWLDKGVDGLRLDVISAISKRIDFPDTDTNDFNETIRKYYSNGPRLREFIGEAREKLWNKYDVVTVGEGPGITPANALDYLDEKRGLNMIFHFGHMFMDQGPGGRFDPVPWTMKNFKQVFKTWNDTFADRGWGSVFLGNHDFPRMVSRWGNDGQYREQSAKLLLTLLLTMRGTPFIYMGDEIGMTNTVLDSVSQSKDIETLNGWAVASVHGTSEATFLKAANYAGRDNARTPMQWDTSKHAGYTSGEPWMPVNKNHAWLNVEEQEVREASILNYFRSLTTLRKTNAVFSYGTYHPIETAPNLFAYYREWAQEKMLIVLNFSDQVTNLPEEVHAAEKVKIIGNYADDAFQTLRPWEAVVYKHK
ncbi:MAG: alpha-glucosidase [Cyclobacteriaceae bacterium]|nr:alpha-glucosidase [Cyclobacteriaceae bacterium]